MQPRILRMLLTNVLPLLLRSRRTRRVSKFKVGGLLALLGLGGYYGHQMGILGPILRALFGGSTSRQTTPTPSRTPSANVPQEGPSVLDAAGLQKAYREKRTDVWVNASGRVVKILPDDSQVPRHQKFLVEVGSVTIKIAHNIDIAPRVPVDVGMVVTFRGEYEWTEEGGTLHWTHRRESGRGEAGWIELAGKRYE